MSLQKEAKRCYLGASEPVPFNQLADSLDVFGGIPLTGPDVALHDPAVPVNQKRLRHAHRLVGLIYALIEIQHDREGEPVRVLERLHGAFFVIDRHSDQLEAITRQRSVEPLHSGHLALARLTPSRPEIHQDNSAAKRVERKGHGAAVGRPKRGQLEFRRDRTAYNGLQTGVALKDRDQRHYDNRRSQHKAGRGGSTVYPNLGGDGFFVSRIALVGFDAQALSSVVALFTSRSTSSMIDIGAASPARCPTFITRV